MTYQPGGSGYGEHQQPAYGQQPQQQYPPQQGQQYAGQQQYGYGQYGGYPQPARQGLPVNLWQYLVYGLGVLGLVNLFIGFAPAYDTKGHDINGNNLYQVGYVAPLVILAAAGLIAAASLLPKQTKPTGAVAALSIVGAVVALFILVTDNVYLTILTGSFGGDSGDTHPDAGIGAILLVVFGFVQAALAVAWLLVEAGVIKTGPAAPQGPDVYAQQLAAQQAAAQQAAAQQQAGGQQYGQQAQTYGQAAGAGYGQTTAVGYGQSSAPTTATPTPAPQSAQSSATPYSQSASPVADDAEAGTSIISTAGTAAAATGDEATTAIGGLGQHSAPAAADDAADKLEKPEGQ
ncbi:DUF5336 domain-containing protein [Jongsikchunia kroppenstedtii]|uniref:DUF5336 domain-containing protein n=1 Tax=Jongsikchunia kroppenstedtii TaxID=1121721 RepID=UPI00036B483D|nr:DUF5336 domain-containing protein [Jongsikchunia kroppenstedtii]